MFEGIIWNGQFSVGDVVTAASVIAATITFFIRSWQAQRRDMRQDTFRLLSRIFEPGPVGEARIIMARWIATNRVIEGDIVDDEDSDRTILSIIDFYEFLCEGACRGVIDWRLVNQESGGRMERSYFVVRDYIRAREQRLTEINTANGLGKVVLYRYLRTFLFRYRGVDTELATASPSDQKVCDVYFAYGSNMDGVQLRERVGEIERIGIAKLADHRLVFNRKGTYRQGGVASVVPSPGSEVFGVVWRMAPAALQKLDAIEDPAAYFRTCARVVLSDGCELDCFMYIGNPEGVTQADPEYLEIFIRAARSVELPESYVQFLELHRK